MSLNIAGIPQCLKDRRAWIVWRFEGNGRKLTKTPYIAALKNNELTYRASSMKPKHWNTFEQAVEVYENSDASGIGYVFSEDDPYAVADFDDALVDGVVDEGVREWLERLDTYTEISVSGTGFHVICEADIGAGASVAGYEVYDRGRYIAMTGDVWGGKTSVEKRSEAFRGLSGIVRERQRRLEGRKGLERRRDAQKPYTGDELDLENFLYDSRVSILREVGDAGGRKFQILCPWLDEHTGGDESGTFAGQFADGALWFDCKHSHCAHRKWREFREAVEDPDGLAEWRRKFEDRYGVELTVGSAVGTGGRGAERETEPDPEPETGTEDPVEAFIRRSRFLLGKAIHDGIDPPEELLQDILLAGKAHNIYAPGGIGKTWVLVWLTRELARLGKTVVCFDLENGRRTYAERFEEVGFSPKGTEWEELDRYVYYFDFPMLHPVLYEGLLDRLKPDIVMFDSWIGFLAADGRDENASNDISMWAERYSKPALRRGTAVLVLDHVPHEEKRERGSSRKRDEMDVVWSLSALKEFDRESLGSLQMSKVKDREGWLPQKISYRVGGDPETGLFTMERDDALVEEVEIVALSGRERRCLDALKVFGSAGAGTAEWLEKVNEHGGETIQKRALHKVRTRLVEKGKVKDRGGVYYADEPQDIGGMPGYAGGMPNHKGIGSQGGMPPVPPLKRGTPEGAYPPSKNPRDTPDIHPALPQELTEEEGARLQAIRRHANLRVAPTAHGDQVFLVAGTLSDEDRKFIKRKQWLVIKAIQEEA